MILNYLRHPPPPFTHSRSRQRVCVRYVDVVIKYRAIVPFDVGPETHRENVQIGFYFEWQVAAIYKCSIYLELHDRSPTAAPILGADCDNIAERKPLRTTNWRIQTESHSCFLEVPGRRAHERLSRDSRVRPSQPPLIVAEKRYQRWAYGGTHIAENALAVAPIAPVLLKS